MLCRHPDIKEPSSRPLLGSHDSEPQPNEVLEGESIKDRHDLERRWGPKGSGDQDLLLPLCAYQWDHTLCHPASTASPISTKTSSLT